VRSGSRKNWSETNKKKKVQWSAAKRNGLWRTPSAAEWKNAAHPVDRTARCIGGCWFTLAGSVTSTQGSSQVSGLPVHKGLVTYCEISCKIISHGNPCCRPSGFSTSLSLLASGISNLEVPRSRTFSNTKNSLPVLYVL
jgi:hypothetical protein